MVDIVDALKTSFYPETLFGGLTNADATVTFYIRVNSLLRPSFTLLDVG